MNHSLRAATATALITTIVSAPFLLGSNNAEADTPRAEVSLPGITVAPTLIIGESTVVVPGITVSVPPQLGDSQVESQQPTATPSQTSINASSGTSTQGVTSQTPTTPQGSQNASLAAPVEPTDNSTTRQQPSQRDTVIPTPQAPDAKDDAHDDDTVVTKVVIGTVVISFVALVGILALFFGYVLGRKDAERYQQGFFRSMLASLRGDY